MESTELTVLDRKALTYDKNKILEVLGVKEMGGHFIDLKICVIPNGKIVYAEILEEETKLDIPVEKKKEFLRAIYEIEFNKSSKKEDCGLFKVE